MLGGAFKDQGHGAHLAVTPSHVVAGPPGSGATTARWSDERLREGWDRLEFTAAATRVHILTFWGGTGALRRRTCCTCAWPPGGKIGPSLCLYGRASIIPAPTWREDGSADPGLEHITSATRSSFSPRVTQKPLTLSRSAVLEWKAILGTEIPSAVSGTGTRKHGFGMGCSLAGGMGSP